MFGLFAALHRIERKIDALTERTKTMSVDTSKLVAVVEQIKADQAKNATDIQAAIALLSKTPAGDPDGQAAIDSAVASLTAVASGMEASNAAAEAALAPPADAVPATG